MTRKWRRTRGGRIPVQGCVPTTGEIKSGLRDLSLVGLATNQWYLNNRTRKKHTKAKLKIEQMKSMRSAK